jgi:FMN-dependent oxidoreductase (nitrilotriacetate monooxygenase family)
MPKRQIHLIGHLCTGPTFHHAGAWRDPKSNADQVLDPKRYEELAVLFERGRFDGVFIVDYLRIPGLESSSHTSPSVQNGGHMSMLDPMLMLAVMARVTKHIGLAATMSTTLYPPYHIARQMATLDHISSGRAGWNIVTSTSDFDARNFGLDRLPDKNTRYDQADETVEACLALWDTWAPDAMKVDRSGGTFADSAKVRFVEYAGSHVKVSGGLTTPPGPQGQPVFMQAGASPRGMEFAARWAEIIFTIQRTKEGMQAFYADIKERVRACGRGSDSCAVLPSIEVFVGQSRAEANEFASYLDGFATPEMGLWALSLAFGVDVSGIPLDTPLSQISKNLQRGIEGQAHNTLAIRKDGRELTLGEAALLQATTWESPRLVGTPREVADEMQDLLESDCCDGFVVTHAPSPDGLHRFVDMVVPELQRRGLYRSEYHGTTFRENLHV